MAYKRISPVPVIEGGTELKTWGTAFGVLCAGTTVTAPVQVLASLGALNTILTSGGAGALPTWTTAVYPATTTINQILYSSAANNIVGLATLASGTLITSAGGVPSISQTLPSAVQGNITAVGALASGSLAAGFTVVTGALGGTGVANTGSTITIGGNVTFSGAFTFTGTITANTSVTFPTSGTLVNTAVTTLSSLVSVGALTTGSLAAGFTPVTVPIGGTGNTTFTAYSVICAGTTATGTFQNVSGVGTSGQVLTSNGASALPTWQSVAVGRLVSYQIFTTGTAATYTKPSGVTSILVECTGGGGGGGGINVTTITSSAAGGGGSGGFARLYIASASGTYTYTVGAAGAAGAAGANAGGNATATTFSTISAGGGNGGAAGVAGTGAAGGLGGARGSSSGGDVNLSGQAGGAGFFIAGAGIPGDGGQSVLSGAGKGTYGSAGSNAGQAAGTNSGSGGAGAAGNGVNANQAGGAGGAGLIVVWEFS
jgi:hypothetical protein